ncbi:SEC10/PgrA surface exclusion domain-containing protein [Streptococcus pneumoniae]
MKKASIYMSGLALASASAIGLAANQEVHADEQMDKVLEQAINEAKAQEDVAAVLQEAKQDVAQQEKVVAAAQAAVEKQQKQVADLEQKVQETAQLDPAAVKEQINSAKATVAAEEEKVTNLEKGLTNLVSEQEKQQKEQAAVQQAVDAKKAEVEASRKKVSDNQVSTDNQAALTEQKNAQQAVKGAQASLTKAEKEQAAAQTALDTANQQNSQKSQKNDIQVDQTWLDKVETYLTLESADTRDFDKISAAKEELQTMAASMIAKNAYKEEKGLDVSKTYDLANLPAAIVEDLSHYAASLLNPIRKQLQTNALVVSPDSVKLADLVVADYEAHADQLRESSDGSVYGYFADVKTTANKVGIPSLGSDLRLSISKVSTQVTLQDLHRMVYQSLVQSVFAMKSDGEALLDLPTRKLKVAPKQDYIGIDFSNSKDFSLLHFTGVSQSYVEHSADYKDRFGVVYNGTVVANPYENSTATSVDVTPLKDTLEKAKQAVKAAQEGLEKAELRLTNANKAVANSTTSSKAQEEALAAAQAELANKEKELAQLEATLQAVTKQSNEVAAKVVAAKAEVETAKANVQKAKAALQAAEMLDQDPTAKEKLAKELEKAKQALAEAEEALAKETFILEFYKEILPKFEEWVNAQLKQKKEGEMTTYRPSRYMAPMNKQVLSTKPLKKPASTAKAALPATGETSSFLSLIGLGLGLLGLAQYKKKQG